ncbi:MAG: AAA family ATPase [Pseudomonadota bacterium]|nr:AAA family ATPase [Pseudomonadota bacterium]
MTNKTVPIHLFETGVPGLDTILGGGLPEFSFNLITGLPGSGKTTLAHQIMFGLATLRHRALYFTVLGEPAVKMLRYQQKFAFYDMDKIGASIRFVSLADEAQKGKLSAVLAKIKKEVEAYSPALVFVDSFRSIRAAARSQSSAHGELRNLGQELAVYLTGWEATTFLVGEYDTAESESNPIFTLADGVICLHQEKYQGSMVRKMEVMKMRGQATLPGMHTFQMSVQGVRAFPRKILEARAKAGPRSARIALKRISTGVERLDELLGGGLPRGYSLLVAGPSGSGKTILATEFLAEGVRRGENGVIAAFEKSPGMDLSPRLEPMVRSGKVGIISTRSLDLSIDETLYDLTESVHRLKAKRVVIDSLSGFELGLAPTSQDFRDSLYRMISTLTGLGVTVLATSELEDRYFDLRFSPYGAAFMTDAIVVQRYVEIDGELKRCLAVVKVRSSDHIKVLHEFKIVKGRFVVGEPVRGYEGLLSGRPTVGDKLPKAGSVRSPGR